MPFCIKSASSLTCGFIIRKPVPGSKKPIRFSWIKPVAGQKFNSVEISFNPLYSADF